MSESEVIPSTTYPPPGRGVVREPGKRTQARTEGNVNAVPEVSEGNGEGGLDRRHLGMARRAFSERWDVPGDVKASVVEECAAIVRNGASVRDRLNAARVLVLCDSVDVRREAIDSAEARSDTQAQVDALRVAMAQPGALDALAALSVSMAQHQAPQ